MTLNLQFIITIYTEYVNCEGNVQASKPTYLEDKKVAMRSKAIFLSKGPTNDMCPIFNQ